MAFFRNSNGAMLRNASGRFKGSTYSLRLRYTGTQFPKTIYTNSLALINLTFSIPTTVRVDYGDGSSVYYNTYAVDANTHVFVLYDKGSTSVAVIPAYYTNRYVYPDATSKIRTVIFYFDMTLLTAITVTAAVLDVQNFDISQAVNLKEYVLTNLNRVTNGVTDGPITGIDFNTFVPSLITNFGVSNVFAPTAESFAALPLAIFDMPLVSLSIGAGGGAYAGSTSANRFNQLYKLAATLVNFSLANYTNAAGLPANFVQLVNLRTFYNSSPSFSTTPTPVLQMSWLVTLTYFSNTNFTNFGDLSNMAALTNITARLCINVSTAVPTGLILCPLLKNLEYSSSLQTTARVDQFINNFYAAVIANAPLTGMNTDTLRGMFIDISTAPSQAAAGIPTGVYRQPLPNVATITITNGGSGYTTAPTVVFTGGLNSGGEAATATAVVSGGVVTAINITSRGHNYATAPTITFSGVGSGAAATASVGAAYQQGVTNGLPNTPREKMWVMVNQYNHTWLYRAS